MQRLLDLFAAVAKLAGFVLALLVFYDALMRYLFSAGNITLQELQWHLFSALFLLGLFYAQKEKRHVRVDILYARFSGDARLLIDAFSSLIIIAFSAVMIYFGYEMALQSYLQHEISPNPGGLCCRWIVKSIIVFGFLLLLIQSAYQLIAHVARLKSKRSFYTALFVLLGVALMLYVGWYYRLTYPTHPVVLLFLLAFVLLLLGVPVAFAFGASALLFALIDEEISFSLLQMLSYRSYGIMQNATLMAVPLFILMGLILERSGVAEQLLGSMARLFGPLPAGIAISVVLVGAILAASTGIVGASVVMMTLLALPLMIKNGYAPTLASGVIAASGTLGQLIPPSIVLIILADQMHISVGDLFKAAIAPGLLLITLYIGYILIYTLLKPSAAPAIKEHLSYTKALKEALSALFLPLLLIVLVLGSIFAGIATPTESASFGVVGALLLAWINKKLDLSLLHYAAKETVLLSAMLFMVLFGATAFSLLFNELGGDALARSLFGGDSGNVTLFIVTAMVAIFVLGFFIDFIEIAFVVVPILTPIAASLGIDPIWFAILIALNLQTSFLTPPFGFALFYLKGAAKEWVNTMQIYKGVLPFIVLQLIALVVIYLYPELIYLFN